MFMCLCSPGCSGDALRCFFAVRIMCGLVVEKTQPSKASEAHSSHRRLETLVALISRPVRVDFREGVEDSNLSAFRVQQFAEWPAPLH